VNLSSATSPATFAGLGAVGLWSLLGLLTAGTGTIPPFQLTSMAFLLASCVGALMIIRTGVGFGVLRQPIQVWALGLYGLFGYHALYFTSQKLAPPAEAGLINSLWPLLIVLFSGLLPGERLQARHIIGAVLGFGGIVVLALGRGSLSFSADATTGYIAALGCALVWSSYSVLSRFHRGVPSEVVTGFCAVTALLSLICHLLIETTVWPANFGVWLCVLAMGIGPVGAAFFLWDHGIKRGDIRLLGSASYATPVVSTLLLVLFGYAQAHWTLGVACLLIVGGAVVASRKN
jgi:drug/metabolite transporter (DMT)-like permease